MPDLWAMGLVGVHDFDGIESWKMLQQCHQDGNLKLRVRENIRFEEIENIIAAGLATDFGNDWLHVGNVKLFADGALGPQTAAMFENFNNSDNFGKLLLSDEEIFEIGVKMIENRLALSVHAIGDLANHIVLNAYERLRAFEKMHGLPLLRHRIEHVQIIQPNDLERLAKLDIIASVQPIHAPSDMVIAEKYLGDRSKYAYPFKSLIEKGTMMVYGSDAPVESVNPFEGIHAAVTRQRKDGSPSDEGWYPDQRISLMEALEGFSNNSALISKRSHHLGQIMNNKKADFIILGINPFDIPQSQLADIKPIATFIEGDCVYLAKDSILNMRQYDC
jgi:predicted amidohydrolase YtcJ